MLIDLELVVATCGVDERGKLDRLISRDRNTALKAVLRDNDDIKVLIQVQGAPGACVASKDKSG